jgi:glutathione-regulated potassium-efflux system ancillary protein KefC
MSDGSLMQDAIVYLGAAVVCVPLASRFKLGSVLGYLAAGCIIGPFGLQLVSDPESTMHFAELGVVLMLFLIGLELDPKRLWHLRKAVFGGGGVQLFVCSALLFVGLLAFGLSWQGSVVAGLALALSSTAVCMQTMSEKNIQHSNLGRSAFGILLFQDIAAIPIVALVPLLTTSVSTDAQGNGWVAAAKVLGALVLAAVIGRYATRPVLRVIAKTGLREVFTAFTLLLVLGVAALMASVGVSMALGAFLAGVLLAGSEYRHALETDIEPFKGLLMGLFFIAVGMSIDFALLAEQPVRVLVLVLGFQLLKGMALRLVAPPLGVDKRQGWLFAALLVQGGEFAFVVFGVARQTHVLTDEWVGLFTLAVALSMMLTPVLLMLEQHWSRTDAKPREHDAISDEGADVILAGFGRFGQIVGRLLFASGFKATVLDHSPDQIDALRKFDFRIYYGDAARTDLLHAAGAARAKVLVNAIDEPETSMRLVEAVQEHFPRLKITARARDVGHYYRLRSRGVEVVERETFESALLLGRRTLEALGVGAYEARETADRFRRTNVRAMEQIFPHWEDENRRIAMAISARQELERQFARDRDDLRAAAASSWHPDAEERES